MMVTKLSAHKMHIIQVLMNAFYMSIHTVQLNKKLKIQMIILQLADSLFAVVFVLKQSFHSEIDFVFECV